ncbi:hypothetical protein PV08_06615 [Exophiala spinifera]|uniref:Transmembrane protein n=1 Tax=Exophiala spinifera TaxID=91928 RepID=A0A0D2B553_9EURO|nr:uncharacterized protein PV08_06615 [Exophiala spinifera]KIW13835.1 hypothetical protein PV08_06615 [Exophiala spinifera]
MDGGGDARTVLAVSTMCTNHQQDSAAPENLPSDPFCQKESSRGRWCQRPEWAFKGWYLLLAHMIGSIALALTVALAINGYNAIDTSTPRYFNSKLHLRVADVTTLVSVGLVVVKFFTTSWAAVAIWKCSQISKHDKHSTALRIGHSQLPLMQADRLSLRARYPSRLPREIWSWIIRSIYLCMHFQQFIAPILSGAVNWNPVSVPGSTRKSVNSTDPTSSAVYWQQYPGYSDTAVAVRQQVLAKAQGLANMAWSDSLTLSGNGSSLTGNGCRHVVNNDGLTTNSTLLDSIVPCIRIRNIEWAKSASEVSTSVANDVFSYASSQLSLVNTSLDLFSVNHGQAMLFDPNLLWNSSTTGLPHSTLVSGPQTLTVIISGFGPKSDCTNIPIGIFGNANIPQYLYKWFYNCHAFANVSITAGVTKSAVSAYVSSNVIEDQTPIDQVTFEANLWVQEALWLLPDLMTQLTLANASHIPTWDNLDAYVENVIRQAYLAAWDSLHQTFDDTTVTNSTISTAVSAVSRIQASVSNARVSAWLGVSLMLGGSFLLDALSFSVHDPDGEVSEDIKEEKSDWQEFVRIMVGGIFPSSCSW